MAPLSAIIQKSFIDIKSFFDELKGICDLTKVKSVVNLTKGLEISFLSSAELAKFVENAPSNWNVRSEFFSEVLVTVSPRFGEGHAMVSDSALWTMLSKYGVVKKGRRLFFKEYPTIENGVRQFVVKPKENATIPSMINFGQAGFRISYKNQKKTCHRCNSLEHEIGQCPVKVCYRCQQIGHEKSDCSSPLVCTVCGEKGHVYAKCPTSWALKVSLEKKWTTTSSFDSSKNKDSNLDKGNNNNSDDIVNDSENKTATDSVSNENSSSVNVQIKKPNNEPATSDSINSMDVDSLVIEETQTSSTDNASQELFSAESSDLTSDDDIERSTNTASSDPLTLSKRPLSSSLANQNPQNPLFSTAPWNSKKGSRAIPKPKKRSKLS